MLLSPSVHTSVLSERTDDRLNDLKRWNMIRVERGFAIANISRNWWKRHDNVFFCNILQRCISQCANVIRFWWYIRWIQFSHLVNTCGCREKTRTCKIDEDREVYALFVKLKNVWGINQVLINLLKLDNF